MPSIGLKTMSSDLGLLLKRQCQIGLTRDCLKIWHSCWSIRISNRWKTKHFIAYRHSWKTICSKSARKSSRPVRFKEGQSQHWLTHWTSPTTTACSRKTSRVTLIKTSWLWPQVSYICALKSKSCRKEQMRGWTMSLQWRNSWFPRMRVHSGLRAVRTHRTFKSHRFLTTWKDYALQIQFQHASVKQGPCQTDLPSSMTELLPLKSSI